MRGAPRSLVPPRGVADQDLSESRLAEPPTGGPRPLEGPSSADGGSTTGRGSSRLLPPVRPPEEGSTPHVREMREMLGSDEWPMDGSLPLEFQSILDDFTERWERGERPPAESFLKTRDPLDPRLVVELVYREFCLAETAGAHPDPDEYLARFPEHDESLGRLFELHRDCSPSRLWEWIETDPNETLPQVGDEIGPYLLRRELGRGAFARVFLAAQSDLEDRLVVVKVSTGPTREPWLLARARHANIVEILSHSAVDDGAFQLICMPFWGGAPLSALLDRRRSGQRRLSGHVLLDDLDAVAAAEFPAVHPARPAREVLRPLNDGRAIAWIVARLAEGLDHAFSREVAHGDIKPSNILLTADGTPMLLDFNLAQDWSLSDADRPIEEPGGTLAYMSPERLHAIATGPPSSREPHSNTIPRIGQPGRDPAAPHQADIFSLGMVLLETLTGQPPARLREEAADSPSPFSGLRGHVACLAAARSRGAKELTREAEQAGGTTIPAGLRTILKGCLAPDPANRYRRALELAEDLDRWRSDRALAYAIEPFWSQTVPRWVRRKRRVLATAAMTFLVGLVATRLAVDFSKQAYEQVRGADSSVVVSHFWDDPEGEAFQYQRAGSLHLQDPDSQRAMQTAARALKYYEVLTDPHWRKRDEVSSLPQGLREDLELWLMEQAYRYGRSLRNRENSPEDWKRALLLVDHVRAGPRLKAFEYLRGEILARLGQTEAARTARTALSTPGQPDIAKPRAGVPTDPMLEEYLLGVVAECADLRDHVDSLRTTNSQPRINLPEGATVSSTYAREGSWLIGSRQAKEHYKRVLEGRPRSFWAHYRAAVVCFRLEEWSPATVHLQECLRLRPGNEVVRGQLTACLFKLDRLEEALAECDRAVEAAPDQAEFYQSRVFVRAQSGKTEGIAEDINRFEFLRRLLDDSPYRNPSARDPGDPRAAAMPPSHRALGLANSSWVAAGEGAPLVNSQQVDRDELEARAQLATALRKAGEFSLASAELDKILKLDPKHIEARLMRVQQAIQSGRVPEAWDDLVVLLDEPGLPDFLGKNPDRFTILLGAAKSLANRGMIAAAMRTTRRAISLANSNNQPRGPTHYYLAQVCSIAARTDQGALAESARQLSYAYGANRKFRQWYEQDHVFDPVRTRLNKVLAEQPSADDRESIGRADHPALDR